METADATPDAGTPTRDLADLAAEQGPFLTVVLTTDPTVENAQQRSELRWKSLRSDVASEGAPEHVLDAIDELVPDAHLQARALSVVANTTGILHVEHGEDPTDPDDRAEGRWAELPWLFPILSWRRWQLPHLVVLIDRSGADLHAIHRAGPDLHREVDPDVDPMQRSKPGGWSQRRFQQRAENTWEEGAGDVAKEVVRLAERSDPRLIVVAGDVRAVGFLRDALPPELDGLVRVIEGERRNADGSGGIPDDVQEIVAEAVREREDAVLAKLAEELGQGDLAVEGPDATLAALAKAQVDTLVIHDDPDDERMAWFGPDPTLVGRTREHLEAMGVDQPKEGRFRDALVRAALGTSASVQLVDPERAPRGGVGAILRWSEG